MRGTHRLALIAMGVASSLVIWVAPAAATPGKSNPCSGCHSGGGVLVSASLTSNDGVNATYSVSSAAADVIAVFEGSTKRASINSGSGSFTVATGKTYTVFAVRGPGENDGIAQVTVAPVATPKDTVPPVTSSNAVPSYTRSAAVHLVPADATSTGLRTYYRINGGAVVEGRSVVFSVPGTHTLTYWSVDSAGNTEAAKNVQFTVTASSGVVARIAGSDRFAVAANIARAGWDPAGGSQWPGVKSVIIANGETGKEADPLAAAGLAGVYDAPVLLVTAKAVPTATRTAITQIAAKNPGLVVRVVGGTASVPDTVANQLRGISGVSATRDRISGSDRYQVTAAIAQRMAQVVGAANLGGAYIINAQDPNAFYDALAASPGAFAGRYALLGVQAGVVPSSVRGVLDTTLAGKPRYVVSAPPYVSASVYTAVRASSRFSATTDRYASAHSIATAMAQTAPVSTTEVGVAAKLPDALTGGVYLGKRRGVMVFTGSASALQPVTGSYLGGNSAAIVRGWMLGGPVSLPETQLTQFSAMVQ